MPRPSAQLRTRRGMTAEDDAKHPKQKRRGITPPASDQ
jgi:hypothetical protein